MVEARPPELKNAVEMLTQWLHQMLDGAIHLKLILWIRPVRRVGDGNCCCLAIVREKIAANDRAIERIVAQHRELFGSFGHNVDQRSCIHVVALIADVGCRKQALHRGNARGVLHREASLLDRQQTRCCPQVTGP